MQEKMDQIGLSDKPEANIASFDNINVEMVQSIADSRFFYLLLKVTATDGTVFPFKEADIPKEAKEIMGIVLKLRRVLEMQLWLWVKGEKKFLPIYLKFISGR